MGWQVGVPGRFGGGNGDLSSPPPSPPPGRTQVLPAGVLSPSSPFRRRAELLIDCEEDWTLRAVLVGMLREADLGR